MLAISVLVLISLLLLAYANRVHLIISLIGYAQKVNNPVAPNRPVNWQNGGVWQGEGKRPPNIVVILTDDMGFNDVSYHGEGLIETPHIDRLAREGVQFTNGYAGSAVCATSRAMLLTGRYSTRFGFEFTPAPDAFGPILEQLVSIDPMPRKFQFPEIEAETVGASLPYEARGLPAEEITLAEELRSKGYRTLHVGKWHLGRDKPFDPRDQGFDESLMMESGLYLPTDSPDVVNARNEFAVLDSVQWQIMDHATSFNGSPRFAPDGYLTDYFTDQAIKAIEANKDTPFFLYLAHWGPHTPLQAKKQDYEAVGDNFPDHRSRVYAGMLKSVDRSVGRVMQALKDNGVDDNTLVIFTSDNGGANYIGMPDINKPFRGWKLSFFEGGTHVPFIMHWPAVLPSGKSFKHPISHLDIFTTALGAADLSPQAEKIDGVNLLPYLTGQKKGAPRDTLIWRSGQYQAILSKGWKMQRSKTPEKVRLFDLEQDPTEQNDVSAAHPQKITELSALLDSHNREQAAPKWPNAVLMPIWVDKTPADNVTLMDDYIVWPN
ncbi:MAG: Arylsulfatase [Alphaproteobacteria bacterium]|nr:MAG: Arylsulfatase [Alphaproteobacteria bacterium]